MDVVQKHNKIFICLFSVCDILLSLQSFAHTETSGKSAVTVS
jgi:hypothetical protein